MAARWHISPTLAGKPGGRTHYDIGADDNENIALVYPAEDGYDATVERARLIANAPETKRQRDIAVAALVAINRTFESYGKERLPEYVRKEFAQVRTAIAECEGDG